MSVARPKQLANRLLRQSLAVIWVIIIILLAVDIMVDYKTHNSDTKAQIQRQVNLIESAILGTMVENNSTELRQLFLQLLGDKRIYRAKLVDTNNRIVGQPIRQAVAIPENQTQRYEYPIQSAAGLVTGTLLIDLDMQQSADSFIRRSIAMTIITILAVSLIAALLYLLFERKLTFPINQLLRLMDKEYKDNQLKDLPYLKNHRDDEIALWIDNTNKLLHSVRKFRSKEFEAKANASRLRRFDELTDLPNRQFFIQHFSQRLNLAKSIDQKPALLIFGLDGFSIVNEKYGNTIGDKLLLAVTKRLSRHRGQTQFISRITGDQFALLCEHVNNSYDASQLAQSMIHGLAKPFGINDQKIQISASVGIALYPQDGKSVELLMVNANKAMQQAKKEGRNRYQYYLASTDAKMRRRKILEDALRTAPKTGQLSLVFQPQFSLLEKKVMGAEALIRWRHPEFGMVSPDEFIPIAEDSSLIIPIGAWVLQKACEQLSNWLNKGEKSFQIAVNLSAVQLKQPGIIKLIETAIKNHNIDPGNLVLEITETSIIDDINTSVSTLEKIHDLGVKIALDDFGTGYSSLNYLKKLPLNKLKIDKSFIAEVTEKQRDGMILQSIIQLAHNLELSVVAEGVETFPQHEFLHNLDCGEGQGYFYSPPLKSREFEELIFDNKFISTEESPTEESPSEV
ncbi:MAG: EAL domain-containing protein [Gammaproteobacteria bacterium]|nr:EAL domain-containing protein [Gammaproteobacteria bacterium]